MRFIFILFLLELALSQTAITILGVKFPVDKYEEVDNNSVIVTIGGISRLLGKDQVEDFIVQNSIGAIKSPNDLSDFTKRAKASGRTDWALRAVQTLCDERVVLSGKDLIVRDVISEFGEFGNYPKALDPECAKEIFLNPDLPPPTNLGILYKLSGVIKEEANKRVPILEKKSAERLIGRLLELYGETDLDVQAIKTNFLKFLDLKESLVKGSFNEAEKLVNDLKETSFNVVLNDLIHDGAKSENNAGKTIKILSFALSSRPSTFKILDDAIERLRGEDLLIFSSSKILKFASQSDKFIPKIKDLVNEALSTNSFLIAEEGIKALLEISPSDGERAVIRIIEKQRAVGLFAEADRAAKLLNRNLTFIEKFRLFLFSDGWLLGITGFSLALTLVLFTLKKKRIKVQQLEEENPKEVPKFVTMQRASGLDRRKDEYAILLEFFELSGEVTEREIKNAFRKKIKEVHPDLVEGQNQDFLKTKESYERLLELHNAFNRG